MIPLTNLCQKWIWNDNILADVTLFLNVCDIRVMISDRYILTLKFHWHRKRFLPKLGFPGCLYPTLQNKCILVVVRGKEPNKRKMKARQCLKYETYVKKSYKYWNPWYPCTSMMQDNKTNNNSFEFDVIVLCTSKDCMKY